MSIICDFHSVSELPSLPIGWRVGKNRVHHSWPLLLKRSGGLWAVGTYELCEGELRGAWSCETSGTLLRDVVAWAELPHD